MHSLSIPADKDITFPEGTDVVLQLDKWLDKKIKELEKIGIKKENMIFDPGIGFGKTPKQSMNILLNADKFHKKGIKVLIGHSEKSFLSLFTDKPAGKRTIETCVLTYILATKNIDFVRVHDVGSNIRAIRIAEYK
jgi:dihydropteroate synthase